MAGKVVFVGRKRYKLVGLEEWIEFLRCCGLFTGLSMAFYMLAIVP
jgi:hypothetical protein